MAGRKLPDSATTSALVHNPAWPVPQGRPARLSPERFDLWAARYRDRLQDEQSQDDERRRRMDHVNPRYILRNYLAQEAIERAQQKDYSEIERLLQLLHDPYKEQPGMERYAAAPPNWGKHLSVSCSS